MYNHSHSHRHHRYLFRPNSFSSASTAVSRVLLLFLACVMSAATRDLLMLAMAISSVVLATSPLYTVRTKYTICTHSNELVSHTSCPFRKLNRTHDFYGIYTQLKPDVELHTLFVSIAGGDACSVISERWHDLFIEFGILTRTCIHHHQVKFSVFKKNTNMRYISFMVHNLTIDWCGHMNGTTKSPILNILSDQLNAYSNMAGPCPYSVSTAKLVATTASK